MKIVSVLMSISLLLTGCAPRIELLNPRDYQKIKSHVLAHRDYDIDLEEYKTFEMISGCNKNFMLEKELIHQLKDSLQNRGFQLNNNNPDLLIYIQFNTEQGDVFTPPLSGKMLSNRGHKAIDNQIEINTFNNWTTSEVNRTTRIRYGRHEADMNQSLFQGYNNKVFINFVDRRLFRETGRTEPIWRGEVKCTGLNLDNRYLSPYIFREALSEFPNSTGRNPERGITLWDRQINFKSKPRASGIFASVILILYIYLLTVGLGQRR